jgi:hypothetical protein
MKIKRQKIREHNGRYATYKPCAICGKKSSDNDFYGLVDSFSQKVIDNVSLHIDNEDGYNGCEHCYDLRREVAMAVEAGKEIVVIRNNKDSYKRLYVLQVELYITNGVDITDLLYCKSNHITSKKKALEVANQINAMGNCFNHIIVTDEAWVKQ